MAQVYRNCADQVRKQEIKYLKRELPEEEYKQIKRVMWPFRKPAVELDEEESELLERVFEYSPQFEKAYFLREELTQIFEEDYTKIEAKNAIKDWCERVREGAIKEFDSFLGTIETWLDKITNYFLERLSSGSVEGFNNRVILLKRRSYGICNVKHIFQRLNLDINGYDRLEFI